MAFDGIVTHSIVKELNNIIINGKINKIYQPTKNEVILDIYNKKKFMLNICIDSSNCRINLTNHLKENPKQAPNFCMLLRKYLTNSKITTIDTYGLDRIVIITLENYNELNDLVNLKLIVELMGKHSNVILLNENNIIIDSLRRISSERASRNILPANPYVFPTSDKLDLLKISKNDFINEIIFRKNNENNLDKIISKLFTGISKTSIQYALNKLTINNINFTDEDIENLYCYLKNIISNTNISCKEFDNNSKLDFALDIDYSEVSINSFIDNFYYNKEVNETFINYRNNVSKLVLSLLSKYNKKLLNIQSKLKECEDMEKYKLYGELITSNLYKINNNINLESIELENYYDNNNLIKIELDKRYSPSLNAKMFFKKYNKLKSTLEIVNTQQIQINNEISYLDSIVYALEKSTDIENVYQIHEEIEENFLQKNIKNTVNKSETDCPKLYSTIIDGFTVYIGKNNKQNDYITFKLSDKNDLWFHVQGFHGSHILLKTNNKTIEDNDPIIYKCAKLAVIHSKASNENKVAVDYTLIKNIKKPKGAKPGFVIFNKYNTIIIENK